MLNKINIGSKEQILIVYIVLTLVTLAVFWQVNQYDFVNFDDPVYVTLNSNIHSGITLDGLRWAFSTTYAEFWHPLTWLSLMFDYQLYGLNAAGYHLTNIILHIMSTLLLFWLFNRMTGAIWRSAFVAALFALHPLHVESVAWIAERKDVLSAFFWMLTLCLYVYYTEKPVIKRYLLVLLSFACGLMSKSMVVTLPIVMIILDYWPLDRLQSRKIVTNMPDVIPVSTNQGKKKNKSEKEALKKNTSLPNDQKLSETKIAGIIPLWQLREKITFFVFSAVFAIITLYAQYKPSIKNFPLGSRIANAPVAFVTYLEKTFWPHDMAIFYPFSEQIPLWQVLGASLLIILISAAVIIMIKRLPYLFVGWLWYAITLLPVIGIIQVGNFAMADRFTYLPSIGLAVMMAWGIPTLIKSEEIRKNLLFPAGIIFLAIISFLSWSQCSYWKNSIILFNHTLKVTDYNWLIYNHRGAAYVVLGNYNQAIEDYDRAIEIRPGYVDAYNNRGSAYKGLGNYRRAIEDYNRAIEIRPGYVDAYNNRGNAYIALGNYKQAIEDYGRAIEIKPDADAYYNRGHAYADLGNHRQAIEDYGKAIEIKPDYADAYLNRGIACVGLGNYKQAIEDYGRAIKIKPGYAEAYINRGNAYNGLGNYNRAIEDYGRAIEIKPGYADAYYNRGVNYLTHGDNISGCRDARKVCELGNCKLLEMAKSKGDCR
jgi:tetratricopeptide (TPR) repeat protein